MNATETSSRRKLTFRYVAIWSMVRIVFQRAKMESGIPSSSIFAVQAVSRAQLRFLHSSLIEL